MENEKLKEVKIEDQSEKLEQMGTIQLAEPKRFEQCEWCYQFDDDEPKIFAWTSEENENNEENPSVTFTVGNTEGAYISFSHLGKRFRLFSRELTDEGKKLREYNEAQMKNFKSDLENLDKKMEEYASENKEA